MPDMVSLIMGQELGYAKGKAEGAEHIVVDGTNMTFADDGEGNLTMTVTEE